MRKTTIEELSANLFKSFIDMGILEHSCIELELTRVVCQFLAREIVVGGFYQRSRTEQERVTKFHQQLREARIFRFDSVAEREVLRDLEINLAEGSISKDEFLDGYEGVPAANHYIAAFLELEKRGLVTVDPNGYLEIF
ncbi:MAG: hypothetical protein AB4352_21195 [Hormoscilla sp.]